MGFNKAFEDKKFMIFYVRKLSLLVFMSLHYILILILFKSDNISLN